METENALELIPSEELVTELGRRSDVMVCAFLRAGEHKDDGHSGRVFYRRVPGVPFDSTCEASIDLCVMLINKIRDDRDTMRRLNP